MVDIESNPTYPAKLRIFDCNRVLIREEKVVYPNNEYGQKQLHFIGVVSPAIDICHITLTVGDYLGPDAGRSKANYRALAIDGFKYGR
ncbi:MAG TPA: hypothetical protein VNJ08_00620 [Bacteriovoracaceae bacterium]|nr:hypothetical protein [Bacteriovoracaceae bacterium]